MNILDWKKAFRTEEGFPDGNPSQAEWAWAWAKWGWNGVGRHKFTRDLRLRRIDKEYIKAVKEKRWKDAGELEDKFAWTTLVQDSDAAEAKRVTEEDILDHFARTPTEPLLTPGGTPPPHTSDEYVEDPDSSPEFYEYVEDPEENMTRAVQDVANRYLPSTGQTETTRPPKRPLSPPSGDGSSNKKGNFGPRHGQAEGEPDPTRHGQPCPDIRPDIIMIEDSEAEIIPSHRCEVCRKSCIGARSHGNCCVGYPSSYYDAPYVCRACWDDEDD